MTLKPIAEQAAMLERLRGRLCTHNRNLGQQSANRELYLCGVPVSFHLVAIRLDACGRRNFLSACTMQTIPDLYFNAGSQLSR
jgi:hypothetical protein